jgi:magnesium-transporting ATPase (P-type)
VLNPLIFILLAAAVASVFIGEATDALFILIVIVLNSGLGAYQEYQAEKSAAGLQRLLKHGFHGALGKMITVRSCRNNEYLRQRRSRIYSQRDTALEGRKGPDRGRIAAQGRALGCK